MISDIRVEYRSPNFIITFPWNDNRKSLNAVRNLPVREWDKVLKEWQVHQLAVASLESLPAIWSEEAKKRRRWVKRSLVQLVDFKFEPGKEDTTNTELRTYQVVGVNFLKTAKRALLADDMGLGKTIQSIQAVLSSDGEKFLIICPATLKGNWAWQFEKHFGIEAIVIKGSAKAREELWKTPSKFKIVNYDLLARDADIMDKEWDGIIADEAVYLKNSKALRTKAARKLKSEIRIALTGFPMEKDLLEFQAIMEWVRPEIIPKWWRFKQRYCVINEWTGAIMGYKNLTELHLLTSPFILRREKGQPGILEELPDKIHHPFPLQFEPKAKKEYNLLTNDFSKWLKAQGKFSGASALEQMVKLRQFVEFPDIIGSVGIPNVKLQWLKELYETVDKLVVFSFFRGTIERLVNEFDAEYQIHGDVDTDDRLKVAQGFNEHKGKAMLVSSDAGRFGLDMIGADTIVHFGYFFNPATMVQREDRLHRFGQDRVVNVMSPFIEDTVDVGIRDRYLSRLADAKDFMAGNEAMSIARLSRKDFEKLVRGK